ncbi:MAG: DUF3017 domain-containing protein, partial [Bifidobacteriaceae bacterium]|nr:DUF3017 domain-containing protein [Bifidobacteriaceae bacterium]
MSKKHQFVSENNEGKPIAEWIVSIFVILFAVLAYFGHITIATFGIAMLTAILGLQRAILKDKAVWKVRSVKFDTIICFMLSI